MSNRRRANRFVLPHAGETTLRLMQDVLVERVSPDAIQVLSDVSLRAEEPVVLELPSGHGARAAASVIVQSAAAVTLDRLRRYRLLLRPASGTPGLRDVGPSRLPAMGVVARRLAVYVRDVSTSGCQLDSLEALADGSIGLLEFRDEAGGHAEAIRVCRVARLPGSPWPWRSGAHFLSLAAPVEASVRNVVARFEIIDELTVSRPWPPTSDSR